MSLKTRFVILAALLLVVFVTLLPNFKQVNNWPSSARIHYGLDIQGGLHLVMGVDVPSVLVQSTERLGDSIIGFAKEKGLNVGPAIRGGDDGLDLTAKLNGSPEDKVRDVLRESFGNLMVKDSTADHITVRYNDAYLQDLKKRTIDQSIETIRNRIDEFGVSEPSITAQGEDRILIQLPGVKDAAGAKELINRTARLEFRIVDTKMGSGELRTLIDQAEKSAKLDPKTMKPSEYLTKLNEALKGKIPEDTIVMFGRNENSTDVNVGRIPYLLKKNVPLGGESVKDSFVAIDHERNEPYVSLNFSADGGAKFAVLTGENIGKQLAVILDNVVYTAPVIQSKIRENCRITLGGGRDYDATMKEAKTITMALRAGALPASLEQLEERTVGPTLGQDSINRGVKASYVAAVLVMLFMAFYYRRLGVLADVALGINLLLILTVLTALNATLTLPGIAGIALTIGIAVDANVIIFERIYEEIRHGRPLRAAVEMGFDRAFWAIFDASICSALTSLILMKFGTGPVRGFAVTLLTGIVTSMFCAVFVTRMFIDAMASKLGLERVKAQGEMS